jgi:hypothetical protein
MIPLQRYSARNVSYENFGSLVALGAFLWLDVAVFATPRWSRASSTILFLQSLPQTLPTAPLCPRLRPRSSLSPLNVRSYGESMVVVRPGVTKHSGDYVVEIGTFIAYDYRWYTQIRLPNIVVRSPVEGETGGSEVAVVGAARYGSDEKRRQVLLNMNKEVAEPV